MLAGIIYLFSSVIVITKLPPQQSSGFVRLSWTTEYCCCQETCVSWCPLESQCDTLQIVNLHLHHNYYSHYFVIKILWMLIIMCRHQHHPQINIITSGFGTAGDSLHSDINTIVKLFSIDPVVHSFIIYFCLPVSRIPFPFRKSWYCTHFCWFKHYFFYSFTKENRATRNNEIYWSCMKLDVCYLK